MSLFLYTQKVVNESLFTDKYTDNLALYTSALITIFTNHSSCLHGLVEKLGIVVQDSLTPTLLSESESATVLAHEHTLRGLFVQQKPVCLILRMS